MATKIYQLNNIHSFGIVEAKDLCVVHEDLKKVNR